MGNTIGSASLVKQDVPETWSTSLTEGDTAAHSFEVTGFSLLDGMGAGNFISSSTFCVGGCEWDITFYPDGSKEDGGAHASAYLRLCNGELGLQTNYTLSLLGKDGQVFEQRSLEHTFQSAGIFWGFDDFVQKSKLRRLLSGNDDCVTIRCVLTVLKERHVEEVSTFIVPIPPSNFHQDFGNMLKDGEGTDVTFVVGDQSFQAHRFVLAARTPFFRAELFGPMKENKMQCINIDDVEPSVFKALLHFIYIDALPDNRDLKKSTTLQHLLVAADRYGLDRLAAMCEGELCRSIDVQAVATTLTLAKQHCHERLKDICIDFMSSRDVFGDVKKTDGFKHLVTSCPEVISDILQENLPLPEVGVIYIRTLFTC
ncbi:hypothetical protein CFC21_025539 [Triticum aestivum]|uniref:BTB domain-containing protein n=2 Tax=Triticum aestivum TaxID=4565 RepID=A0A3B6CD76_WHEAT|nr:hypothetical protein CFC21_025539 [Triticum aestivum]